MSDACFDLLVQLVLVKGVERDALLVLGSFADERVG
jgi:hypothetical protein